MTAREHLEAFVAAYRALGAASVGIVDVPAIGPDAVHVSIDGGPPDAMRALCRELGTTEPEVCKHDSRAWLGADARLGDVTVTVRIRSDYFVSVEQPAQELAS